jgi:predicted outer membrane lipoprotein
MVAESLAAEVGVAEALALEHHAHRPVKDRDPLLE